MLAPAAFAAGEFNRTPVPLRASISAADFPRRHAAISVDSAQPIASAKRSPRCVASSWSMLAQSGFWSNFAASGGRTEEIDGDAYSQEHHCALWDALRTAKAP
jgi:hypothetical protein